MTATTNGRPTYRDIIDLVTESRRETREDLRELERRIVDAIKAHDEQFDKRLNLEIENRQTLANEVTDIKTWITKAGMVFGLAVSAVQFIAPFVIERIFPK